MNITDCKVRLINKGGNLKGVASITIDDALAVHDIKIIEGQKGLFIAMPSRKDSSKDEYRDITHPINVETREQIQSIIMDAYEKEALKNE